MKNLLAVVATLWAMSLSAQTETTNFPYNPDSDGDGVVGVADILALLNTFGQEFQVQVTINSDSTSAIVHLHPAKLLSRDACRMSCDSLPGPWTILTEEGFYQHAKSIKDSLAANNLNTANIHVITDNQRIVPFTPVAGGGAATYLTKEARWWAPDWDWSQEEIHQLTHDVLIDGDYTLAQCFCEVRQRPRIEYTQCEGNPQSVLECVQNKTEVGWYPLDLIPFGDNSMIQTLWRWKD